jgi:hypothetical protein
MMEFRVVFQSKVGKKAKRVSSPNPLSALNHVLEEWEDVSRIHRIERVVETEDDEMRQLTELSTETVEHQHIHVDIQK